MNTDLEKRLRESASAIAMDRAVDDVMARGDRLRRRRSRGLVVGAGAAATVAALAASITLPTGSNPVVPAAVASWSGGQTNLSSEELQEVTETCLEDHAGSGISHSGSFPADTLPIAAEWRDGTVLAYFRHGGTEVSCIAEQSSDGTLHPAGVLVDEESSPLPPGTDLDDGLGFGYSDPGTFGGPVNELWTVGQVSSRVDRVSAEIGGDTFDGTVVDGVVLFWISDSFTPEQVDDAVFTAYDAGGDVLARVDKLAGADDPQGPNDDRHR